MKHIIRIFLLTLLAGCSDQPVNHLNAEEIALYQSWKSGQFYYREKPFGVFLVNRYDTLQEEFIRSNGMLVEFGVNWINDSVYELRFDKIVENPREIILPDGIDTMVKRCKLTSVTDTSYIELAYSNMSSDIIATKYRRPKQHKAAQK